MAADTAERDAVLSAARAEAARKQEEHDQAQLHDTLARSQQAMAERYRGFEGQFARTQEARQAWEETTRQQRHDALAAHTEYVRRNPDTDLPPLKSAEPQQPTEEERGAAARACGILHLTSLGGRHGRAHPGRQRGDSRPAQHGSPDEDHEWQGQPAWADRPGPAP